MSASKNKIVRKQQIEAGTDKKTVAALKAEQERRKSNIKYIIVGVIVVLFIAFILVFNSNFPSQHMTAVTIDGVDYTVAQTNYYYSSSYNNFYNNYYTYISYGMFFDTSTSLADQEYEEGTTWRQYFLNSAIDSMTEIQLLNDAAEAAGFVLPEDYQTQYDESIASIETSWANYGYTNLKQYLNLNYGKGVTMDLVREELYRTVVASAYAEAVYDGYEYTTEELDAYYAEHEDELDIISYAYYTVSDETTDADAIAAAVNGTSEDAFNDYLSENYDGAEATSLNYAGSNLSEVYSEWLLDSARQVGDAAALTDEESTTTYVVMFLGRDNNDYNTVNFRHILINAADTDGDGVYSEEELAAAESAAQDIYENWQADDPTEDGFAEYANANSEDSGSNTNGGLYETVYKNEMVAPVNDWLFEEGRQPGDTTVVTYDGANYTGAHVLYFVGTDDLTYARYQADTTLRNEDYTAWMEEAETGYESVTHSIGMCGKNH